MNHMNHIPCYTKVIFACSGHHGGVRGPHAGAGWPFNDDGEGTDDGELESDDDNNDQVSGDLACRPCHPWWPRCGCGPEEPLGPIGAVAPVFMNLHSKCLRQGDLTDAQDHHLHSSDWMISQGIVEHTKHGRFCLTLVGSDVHLWYKSIIPVGNGCN